jgi:pyruvate dehydrogenase E2 component (dihydrolipoamide acetyltransferase)
MAQPLAASGKGRRDVAIATQEAGLREARTGAVGITEVKVPDIGDFKDVPIIEVHVRKGDAVNADDPLITLESDKASMEVPAPIAGTVQELYVTVGDRVSEGRPILALEAGDGALAQPPSLVGQQEPPLAAQPPPSPATPAPVDRAPVVDFDRVHASPSVRRAARELGVDLAKIKGTGEKGRITKEDVIAFLKGPAVPAAPAQVPAGAGIPEIPPQDFARFGPVETKPLSRIKRISGSTSTAPGSTSPMSRSRTRPTSPTSRPTARSWTRRRGMKATGSRCWPS